MGLGLGKEGKEGKADRMVRGNQGILFEAYYHTDLHVKDNVMMTDVGAENIVALRAEARQG